jgi:hypothetical protein
MNEPASNPSPPSAPDTTPPVSELPLDGNGDDDHETGCRHLLEMHQVRRRVERGAVPDGSVRRTAMAVRRVRVVRARLERIPPVIAVEPPVVRGAP